MFQFENILGINQQDYYLDIQKGQSYIYQEIQWQHKRKLKKRDKNAINNNISSNKVTLNKLICHLKTSNETRKIC